VAVFQRLPEMLRRLNQLERNPLGQQPAVHAAGSEESAKEGSV
jgi:hypothetical protein